MGNAATYCRSSKDRSDVSISSQKHELDKLAASRGLIIVKSYEDAVESGSTEDRPAFIELVRALKEANRGWTYLLVYDTSRIARRRYIAQAIKHEAKKRGVVILYARLPADLDPVAELVLESVFEAMDEAHSLMSREKGLAGMAENVRRGWRAGGRAPMGYRLESLTTGAVREGRPVTKSRLILAEGARAVGVYLKERAAGTPRCLALKASGLLDRAESTMICVEWNALAYAGHTIWNRHAVQGTGQKRRPRAQWHIKRDTHPALITEAEAETILAQLENSEIGAAVSRAKAAGSSFLLTGLLYTSDGRMWVGHGARYRLRAKDGKPGKTVPTGLIDEAVMGQFASDMASDDFLGKLLAAVRRIRRGNPTGDIEASIRKAEREKTRAAELALSEGESEVYLALVRQRSVQIDALKKEADAVRADGMLTRDLGSLSPAALRSILADRGPAKALQGLVERVILEPSLTCRLEYRAIHGRRQWLSVASPRGFDSWPPDLTSYIRLKGAA